MTWLSLTNPVTLPPFTSPEIRIWNPGRAVLLALFLFDFTGLSERKNPYAALTAFHHAFPDRHAAALLVHQHI
jgi:hypothetical protein